MDDEAETTRPVVAGGDAPTPPDGGRSGRAPTPGPAIFGSTGLWLFAAASVVINSQRLCLMLAVSPAYFLLDYFLATVLFLVGLRSFFKLRKTKIPRGDPARGHLEAQWMILTSTWATSFIIAFFTLGGPCLTWPFHYY